MLVDDLGEVTITNDGATILQQLDVQVSERCASIKTSVDLCSSHCCPRLLQHPAAKVLVELADLQDREVGD
eukprot:COSAG06_NODE_26060_length_622_cov_4.564054_1_plen_70_part_01